MIDPKELRIGNLVSWNDSFCTVTSIQSMVDADVEPVRSGYTVDLEYERQIIQTPWVEDINPIPLTPQWLERCGFEYDNIVYSLGPIWLAEGRSDFYDVFLSGLSGGIVTRLQYLHELQNLCYIINGQEITIKEACTDLKK